MGTSSTPWVTAKNGKRYPPDLIEKVAKLRGIAPAARARREPQRYCPHTPWPKQAEFLALDSLEALYGGAAGGGKSMALLMAALQYIHVPGYAALLLRRTFPDLSQPGALMDLANDWLRPTDARWHDQTKTWSFPSGATLSFGYLETENQKYRYQGAEYQYIGWDEATQFTETSYRYLLSRARKPVGLEVPVRVRCASNPGGLGHEWVKAMFVDPGDPSRPFIPARLEDNPGIDIEAYERSLARLDHITRRQLREGDWDVRAEGGLFKREWFAGKLLDAAPAGLRTLRWWDLAATVPKPGTDPDWTAGLKLGRSQAGVYTILDVQRFRASPREVEARILQTAQLDGRDTLIYMEQEPGSSGVTVIDHYTRNVLGGYAFQGVRSTGDKVDRARPVSSQAEAGNIYLLSAPWAGILLDELAAFPAVGVHDDQVDALSGALGQLHGARELRFN